MPVTIHYNGNLDDRARLADLLDAARLYCAEQRWMYRDIEEPIVGHVERLTTGGASDAQGEIVRAPIDDFLQGILITPNVKTEPLWFTFNSAGALVAYLPLNEPDEFWERGSLSIDTQAAGIAMHIAICEFLQAMRDQYMPGLNVLDETNYFESGDVLRAERAIDESTSYAPDTTPDPAETDEQNAQLPQAAESSGDHTDARRKKKTNSGRSQSAPPSTVTKPTQSHNRNN